MEQSISKWRLLVNKARHDQGEAVVQLVQLILETALDLAASDVHIEPYKNEWRIRYRLDGILQSAAETLAQPVAGAVISRLKLLASMDIATAQRPQDGHINFSVKGQQVDIRAASMPSVGGEMLVLRFMNSNQQILALDKLAFSEVNFATLNKIIHRPAGLFLVCGPMNSGKSTTLYAALTELNTPERNIITLEDPVEWQIPGLNQVQLNPKAGLDYVAGLKAALRQDAQILLLSEIRDETTAAMTVRMALTGHFLMSTLHTENAIAAIYRLLEMGIAPYLLAGTLTGILAQRLVRKLCPDCATAYTVTPESPLAALLGSLYRENRQLWHAVGCEKCRGTGYRGRLAIQEIIVNTADLQQAILGRQTRQQLEQKLQIQGQATLWSDGISKAYQGLTTVEEVRRVLYG